MFIILLLNNNKIVGSNMYSPLFIEIADRVRGKSNDNDFTLAAEACVPIISTILADIKNKIYPQNCFLNITVPTDVLNHKVKFAGWNAINVAFICDLANSIALYV